MTRFNCMGQTPYTEFRILPAKADKLDQTAIKCSVLLLSGEIDRTVVVASTKRYKGQCDYEYLTSHSHWPLV